MQSGNKPGLVINMSSVAGRIGFAFTTSYCAAKFGIEGFTESLRREMLTRNVRVALIEAGIIHTNFFNNITRTKQSYNSNYAKDTQVMEDLVNIIKNETKWTSPKTLAKIIVEEIIPENGEKFRYVVGIDAEYLINAIYTCRNDKKCMDDEINNIISLYLN